MADIFISYSHDDRIKALRLVRALESQGLTVWWDRQSIPGTLWDRIIRSELKSARCVIVAWSETSSNSTFVKEEAGFALAHDKYLPVTFDQIAPPSQFGIEILDLSRWLGSEDDPNFVLLISGIERLLGAKSILTGSPRRLNKNRSKLKVWGITIGGTFFGLVSGIIAKPIVAAGVFFVVGIVGIGGYLSIKESTKENNTQLLSPPPGVAMIDPASRVDVERPFEMAVLPDAPFSVNLSGSYYVSSGKGHGTFKNGTFRTNQIIFPSIISALAFQACYIEVIGGVDQINRFPLVAKDDNSEVLNIILEKEKSYDLTAFSFSVELPRGAQTGRTWLCAALINDYGFIPVQ